MVAVTTWSVSGRRFCTTAGLDLSINVLLSDWVAFLFSRPSGTPPGGYESRLPVSLDRVLLKRDELDE